MPLSPAFASPEYTDFGSAARSESESTGGLVGEPAQSGSGTFGRAPISESESSHDGTPITVAIATERGIAVDRGEFADLVMSILHDERGWEKLEDVSFVQVDSDADVTIRLATPPTVDRLCAPLDTAGYTSCRVGDTLVINVNRWAGATEGFFDADGTIDTYREYLINHEMGHFLGYGHDTVCRPDGSAPVMMQQTLDMRGCTAQSWPG